LIYVLDASNWTDQDLTPDILAALWALGVRLIIVQAVVPPAGYPPSKTVQQIQACIDWGMPVGFYVFWWAGAGTDYLARHMATLDGFEGKLVCGAVDCEDTTVRALRSDLRHLLLPRNHLVRIGRQAPPPKRSLAPQHAEAASLWDDIQSWVRVVVAYPTTVQIPMYYSGPWYWGPYLGNPSLGVDDIWWTAEYDNDPDPQAVTLWGGKSAPADLKQFRSGSAAGVGGIDWNVASDRFVQLITLRPADPKDKRIYDLQNALGWVTWDQQQRLRENLSAHATKATIQNRDRQIADELERVRRQFLPDSLSFRSPQP
jgi:hypothetical protein